MTGNGAPYGAGIQDDQGPLTIGATIVANSTSGNDCFLQGVSSFTDDGYNLDDDGTCGFTSTGDQSDTPAGLDPSGLQNNGGPTQTVALEGGECCHWRRDQSFPVPSYRPAGCSKGQPV